MHIIFDYLSKAISFYLLLIFIRIIISWFGGSVYGKPVQIISAITDPYLDFWRRNFNLRVGFIDFSAVAGIIALSLVQRILFTISDSQSISIGNILAVILLFLWSFVSYILGFLVIVMIIRLVVYYLNINTYNSSYIYSNFIKITDALLNPVMYKISRIFFGSRIVKYSVELLVSILLLIAISIAGKIVITLIAGTFDKLPI